MKGYEIGLSSMICVDQEIALGPAAKAGDKKQVPALPNVQKEAGGRAKAF